MTDYSGIRDFAAAITGGGNTVGNAHYDAAMSRLIRQRASQTSLDKQLEQLAREKDVNRNRTELSTLIEDPLVRAVTLAGQGAGTNYAAAQRGTQTSIENDVLNAAVAAITGATESGGQLPVDLLNALTGVARGKLLAPTNVSVQEQADADIERTAAQTALDLIRASDLIPAQADAATALAEQRRTPRAGSGSNSSPITLNRPSDDQMALLFEEVAPARLEESILPFGIGDKAIEAELKDLYPEFEAWRARAALSGRDVKDPGIAIQQFLSEREGGQPIQVSGESSPSAPVVPTVLTQEDADAAVAYANELIQAGYDRDEVMARLAQMGISLQ